MEKSMKKLLITLVVALLVPTWAAAAQGLNAGFASDDLTLFHEQGTVFEMEWGSQTAIINGYRYRFAPDAKVQINGMRNSNVMAIAPTATIANITGVSQSIEPTYQNLYVKSNLSGEFTVVNPYMVRDLKAQGLWDKVMVNDLKYYDGSLSTIDRIPDDLKQLYATAFEVEPRWLVDAASRRQKWIDQGQSLNLYMAGASGKKLDVTYRMAWLRGLKTTYYLRSLGATSTEKSTLDRGTLNAVQPAASEPQAPNPDDIDGDLTNAAPVPQACSIDDPDCDACQ